mmetsp:Transcript_7964/g.15567  ORF Transcript_7964/g.15567 Transcript_7964/m.15567 type:complete len:121 (-) Transcript_7964:399-761(-)
MTTCDVPSTGFHAQCIIPWFERSGNCPVCKMHYNQLHSTGLRDMCSCCNDLGFGLYQRLRNPPEEEEEKEPEEEETPLETLASRRGNEDGRDTRVCIGEMPRQGFNEESKHSGPSLLEDV